MASREDLLQSIQPGMKLTRAFFLKVYGYEITWPGFKEQAITALEAIGCSKGREYYNSFVREYQEGQQERFKPVVSWFTEECNRRWEKLSKEGRKGY